jgi:hypothetical protein
MHGHESMQALMEKRAAIFDDRDDNQLKVKDRSVFMYRSNRLVQCRWVKTQEEGTSAHMTEEEHNAQYDQEQLDLVHEAISRLNKNTTKTQQNLAMALPGKVAARFSQRNLSFLSSGAHQERHTATTLSLNLVPIADTARTTATHSAKSVNFLSLFIFITQCRTN